MRITICGPIEYWWGERWASPEHNRYRDWREAVSTALVNAGHLVYRPHEAFKGMWDDNDGDEFGQLVNDAALLASQLVIFLTPEGVPSEGCDGEREFCEQHDIPMVDWPLPSEGKIHQQLKALISTLAIAATMQQLREQRKQLEPAREPPLLPGGDS